MDVVVGVVTPSEELLRESARPPITIPAPSKTKNKFGPEFDASLIPAGFPAGNGAKDWLAAKALEATSVVARSAAPMVRMFKLLD